MERKLCKALACQRNKLIWWYKNKHNTIKISRGVNPRCVTVGNYSYGWINVNHSSANDYLKIGSFVSIADEVLFLFNEHPTQYISSFPIHSLIIGNGDDRVSKGEIIVEDDVWIGTRCTILSGVTIGQGAIVGAGALVAHDIPPYAIVGGVPAKVIKYRFSSDIIQALMKIDYSKLTREDVAKYEDLLSSTIDNVSDDLLQFIDNYKK